VIPSLPSKVRNRLRTGGKRWYPEKGKEERKERVYVYGCLDLGCRVRYSNPVEDASGIVREIWLPWKKGMRDILEKEGRSIAKDEGGHGEKKLDAEYRKRLNRVERKEWVHTLYRKHW
jgi:hypothetical protein